MSPLRLRMLEYMQLKHYSPTTIKNYLSQVSHFARYLGKSPAVKPVVPRRLGNA
jgi:hypothetical protein